EDRTRLFVAQVLSKREAHDEENQRKRYEHRHAEEGDEDGDRPEARAADFPKHSILRRLPVRDEERANGRGCHNHDSSPFCTPPTSWTNALSRDPSPRSSSNVPQPSSLPRSMIAIRSQSFSTMSRMWLVKTSVVPRRCNAPRMSLMVRLVTGSIPSNGS